MARSLPDGVPDRHCLPVIDAIVDHYNEADGDLGYASSEVVLYPLSIVYR